ncbi:hypothetical protein KEM55_008511 [Ascosphaera atra]|nr:hypothetical protein KEM55_008511 [Ascosphaera atra]
MHAFCFIITRSARTARYLARCANAPEEPVPVLGPEARTAGVVPSFAPASVSVPASAPVTVPAPLPALAPSPVPATSPSPGASAAPAPSALPVPSPAPAPVSAPVLALSAVLPAPSAPGPAPALSVPPAGGDEFIESVAAAATEEPIVVASRSPSWRLWGPPWRRLTLFRLHQKRRRRRGSRSCRSSPFIACR